MNGAYYCDYNFVNRNNLRKDYDNKNARNTIIKRKSVFKKYIFNILNYIDNNYYLKLFLLSISILMFVLFLFVFILSKPAKAEDVNQVRYKYFHVITVDQGDSLWSLAEECGYDSNRNDFIDEVMDMNHMTTTKLREGQKLAVPYYSYEFR